jgi:hydrogenase maturation protease
MSEPSGVPRIVLFGYGNPSRGDDALGPMLLERAEAWLATRPDLAVELVADFQLQIEHALDIQDRDLALFLDADIACTAPFSFRRAQPSHDASYTTHELSPGAVLHVCQEITGQAPPPAFILSVRGERFELGEPISPAAALNMDAAWAFLKKLLEDGHVEAWEERVTAADNPRV